MTTGERVRFLRKTLGLTLEQFGDSIGLKPSSLSNIESGVCSLTNLNTLTICREFNVNQEWLLNGTGDIFRSTDEIVENFFYNLINNTPDSDFKKRFILRIASADAETRQVLSKLMNFHLDK